MSRVLSIALASLVFSSGCAATMKLSPRDEALFLLPQNSTASITAHFEHSETHVYRLHQAYSGDFPSPIDAVARAAGNRPVRNVEIASSPDWLRLSLKLVGGLGAWALLHSASPSTQPLGPLAYLLVMFAVPEAAHYRVQGEFVEGPHALKAGQ
ncbi:hypothetical protein D3C87_940390 [compost metagenome]